MEDFTKVDEKSRVEVNKKELTSLEQTLGQIKLYKAMFKSNEISGQETLDKVNALMHIHNSKVSVLNQMRAKKIEIRELESATQAES